jgi:hypothetical protein
LAESPLGRLIGAWEFETKAKDRSMGHGRATFEWIEDGTFVLERSDAEWSDPGWVENAPASTRSVIGWDDSTDEMVQLYSDSRGVTRIYRMTLTDDAWALERAAPDFHQRFIGTFRDDGRTIEGQWDSSPDGTEWELDFPMTYHRVTDA